jgi:hypothetical protein
METMDLLNKCVLWGFFIEAQIGVR